MPKFHHLAPALRTALLVLLSLSLVGASVVLLERQAPKRLGPGAARSRGSTARLAQSEPRVVAPKPETAEKPPAAAPSSLPPEGGTVPYPLDAMAPVATGQLIVAGSGTSSGGTNRLTVQIPAGGWAPGQRVFLFLGEQCAASASVGGSAVIETVWSPGLTVTGFQFPADNPAAPIDGYGSALVPRPS